MFKCSLWSFVTKMRYEKALRSICIYYKVLNLCVCVLNLFLKKKIERSVLVSGIETNCFPQQYFPKHTERNEK